MSATHVAFLRGINVGKNNQVRMEELRKVFKSMGFSDIQTISVAGNVLFTTETTDTEEVSNSIERNLKKAFKFDIPVSVRTIKELSKLVDSNPFKGIEVTENTRLYVSFISGYFDNKLKVPFKSPQKDYTILSVSEGEVCSVVTINGNTSTPDLMSFVDKQFGKRSTTRNLNTIEKVIEAGK